MTLREYIEGLKKLAKERPETLDLEVVYSRDAEGNGFEAIYWAPSLGCFKDRDFTSEESVQDEDYETEDYPLNAVCVN